MDPAQSKRWMDQMRSIWELKDTDELLSVWQSNNREEWTDEVFEVIREIVTTRGGNLPLQSHPVTKVERIKKNWFHSIAIIGVIIAMLFLVYLFRYPFNPNFRVIRDETLSILLSQSTDQKQLVYEDERVVITIGYDQIRSMGIDHWESINDERFDEKFSNQNVIVLNKHDHQYLIAEALEAGKAKVFDKRHQESVTRIKIRNYEFICGPLCGSGSRTFYLPDINLLNWKGTQFFEVRIGYPKQRYQKIC